MANPRKPIRAAVMRHFEQSPGKRIYLADLAIALNDTEERIRDGISNLRREVPEWANTLVVDVAGHAWRYQPEANSQAGKRLFEELAVTRAGEILVQDEQGAIYKLAEI